MVESIERARQEHPFDLWSWVLMPEHVHLLVWPAEQTKVRQILRAIKRPVAARAINWVQGNRPDFLVRMRQERRAGKWVHRFWQRGPGYDRNMWSVAEIREKIRYIHENPMRRGLVDHPRDWPWSSWRAWEEGVAGPLRIDFESVPTLG